MFVVFAKIYLQLYQNGIPTLLFLLIFVVFAKIYLQLYQNGIPTISMERGELGSQSDTIVGIS
jgi:hypothetical protein